jgi:hypothetical protein
MGCLIKAAPHNISTSDNLVGVTLDILARNCSVVVVDAVSSYP